MTRLLTLFVAALTTALAASPAGAAEIIAPITLAAGIHDDHVATTQGALPLWEVLEQAPTAEVFQGPVGDLLGLGQAWLIRDDHDQL
ncbi:MAG: hypothetical protein KC613_09760, partial [Myxococcales bacterium]|nr:hypothetical protein [Myxococcales bacterium]